MHTGKHRDTAATKGAEKTCVEECGDDATDGSDQEEDNPDDGNREVDDDTWAMQEYKTRLGISRQYEMATQTVLLGGIVRGIGAPDREAGQARIRKPGHYRRAT